MALIESETQVFDTNQMMLLCCLTMATICTSVFAAVGTNPIDDESINSFDDAGSIQAGIIHSDVEEDPVEGKFDAYLDFQVSVQSGFQCASMQIDAANLRLTPGGLDFAAGRVGCLESSRTVTVMILADGADDPVAGFLLQPLSPSIQIYSVNYLTLQTAGVISTLSFGGRGTDFLEVAPGPTTAEIIETITHDREFALRFANAALNLISDRGHLKNSHPVDTTQIVFQAEIPEAVTFLTMGRTEVLATR